MHRNNYVIPISDISQCRGHMAGEAFREMKGRNAMAPICYRRWNSVGTYLTVLNHLTYLLTAAERWRLLSAGRKSGGGDR